MRSIPIFVLYPLIPWVGVTAAGFGLGQIYRWEAEARRKFLLRLGLGVTAAFVVLRAINRYGDCFTGRCRNPRCLPCCRF